MKGLILAVSVLAAVLATSAALECYECNSVEEKTCADPFNTTEPISGFIKKKKCKNNLMMTALGGSDDDDKDGKDKKPEGHCAKVKTTDKDGKVDIVRSCGPEKTDMINECKSETLDDGTVKELCHCSDKDFCNGANANLGGLLFAVVTAAVAKMCQ